MIAHTQTRHSRTEIENKRQEIKTKRKDRDETRERYVAWDQFAATSQ
jgi:hypothetical protein